MLGDAENMFHTGLVTSADPRSELRRSLTDGRHPSCDTSAPKGLGLPPLGEVVPCSPLAAGCSCLGIAARFGLSGSMRLFLVRATS